MSQNRTKNVPARKGRPPIKRKPMTPAERQKRSREARRAGKRLSATPSLDDMANEAGISKSTLICQRAVERQGVPEIQALIGRVNVNLLASLARNTRKDVQRRFAAIFESEGPKAARTYAKARLSATGIKPDRF